ncbi:MAG: hypothetical protein AAFV54_15890 [Pseudomonadota bacterium]
MRPLAETSDFSFVVRESSAADGALSPTTARMDAEAEANRGAFVFESGSFVVPLDEIDFSTIERVKP